MTEWMLEDAARAHDLRFVVLRYFNVAGADPKGRSGQSTPAATHLIKVAAQAALGQRPHLDVFGTDYPTPDGTCIRDYVQVNDLARAHLAALDHLRGGGDSTVMNCGYGHGSSVLEVIEVVKRVSGVDFEVRLRPRRPGRSRDARREGRPHPGTSAGCRATTTWTRSSIRPCAGNASSTGAPERPPETLPSVNPSLTMIMSL